jgi:hypothetical protein
MPFRTPKASDVVLVTHPDTQNHSSAELNRATVSVVLTGRFCFDDELEYMHLNPRAERAGESGLGGSELAMSCRVSSYYPLLLTTEY